jgi:peptidoglycan/LPS O-acetylase OafA/YrhL
MQRLTRLDGVRGLLAVYVMIRQLASLLWLP